MSARISVIFKSEGFEFVLVFCGRASNVWSAQKPNPMAPAADFKKVRRGLMLLAIDMVNTLPFEVPA